MKCHEVSEQLVAYLNHEVSASEGALIRAHLAECALCQQKVAELAALQSRVSRFLQVRAVQAAPSPQAWSRLQARLAGEARPAASVWLPPWLQRRAPGVGQTPPTSRGITMKKGLAFAAIAMLVLALSVVALVPPVRANVIQLFKTVFRFRNGSMNVVIETSGGPASYQMLEPGYLPEMFSSGPVAVAFGDGPDILFQSGDQFLIIAQKEALAGEGLPEGEQTTVNGLPAVLNTGLSGTFPNVLPPGGVLESSTMPTSCTMMVSSTGQLSGIVPLSDSLPFSGTMIASGSVVVSATVEQSGGSNAGEPGNVPPAGLLPPTFDYTNATRLTMIVGHTRIELLSNLPIEEIIKVAEGLTVAK